MASCLARSANQGTADTQRVIEAFGDAWLCHLTAKETMRSWSARQPKTR
jgi:hypothetical protein